jgi:hypothetical protein
MSQIVVMVVDQVNDRFDPCSEALVVQPLKLDAVAGPGRGVLSL